MKTAFHFLYAALLILVSTPLSQGNLSYNVIEDKLEECADWAEQGECTKNPRYMEENCPASCKWQASEDERTKKAIGKRFNSTIYFACFSRHICVLCKPQILSDAFLLLLTPNKPNGRGKARKH
mmetsp:Transcript_1562/g.2480  ORF Transcript_1562/g.2480 Transcript_1562/m.2480 type:complete len:124 (+) Transcript_1562:200-571(+)